MSNRRRPTTLDRLHEQVEGQRLPGGCDDCDAYQTLDKHDSGVFMLAVHHDDTCPFYRGLNR